MSPRPRRAWSKVVQEAGISVRVYEREPGGVLYREVRDGEGGKDRRSLQHKDRKRAEADVRAFAKRLAELRLTGVAGPITLGQAWMLFQQHRLPLLSAERQMDVQRHARYVLAHFGRDFRLDDLSQSHVDAFVAARQSGAAMGWVERRPKGGPKPVRAGTIRNTVLWLSSLCRWARSHRVNGRRLMVANPFDGIAVPQERNPKRPVANVDRYTKTLEHTETADPTGRLTCLLTLARETGRRINALCQLRASDVHLSPEAVRRALAAQGDDEARARHMPNGAIRFRAEHDKLGFDDLAPISRATRAALDAYLRRYLVVGEAPLFPYSAQRPNVPMTVRQASHRLAHAEELAELPKLDRGLWHAYRRAYASERKHLPDVDVARSAGWRDVGTMKRSYQQSDPATLLRAIENEPDLGSSGLKGDTPQQASTDVAKA